MSFFGGVTPTTTITFDIEPIPKGTTVLAAIESIKWSEYQGERYIDAAWAVLDGEYKGRKIFQKLRVVDSDDKKKERALRMLAAIDKNGGGHLFAAGTEPTDESLQRALANKMMRLKLDVWNMEGKSGNFVCAVSPKNEEQPANFDGDVPF